MDSSQCLALERPAPVIDHRYQILCEGYLVHGNAAKAARDAGFSARGAKQIAMKILGRPDVQAYLAFRRVEIAEATGLQTVETIRELKSIAHSRIDHYKLDAEGRLTLADHAPPDAMAAVASFKRTVHVIPRKDAEPEMVITSELRLWPKMEALRMEGEILELVGKNSVPAPLRAAIAVEAKSDGGRTLRVQVCVVAE
jgi:hypothetical protein